MVSAGCGGMLKVTGWFACGSDLWMDGILWGAVKHPR
jgi:hypothetical protein